MMKFDACNDSPSQMEIIFGLVLCEVLPPKLWQVNKNPIKRRSRPIPHKVLSGLTSPKTAGMVANVAQPSSRSQQMFNLTVAHRFPTQSAASPCAYWRRCSRA